MFSFVGDDDDDDDGANVSSVFVDAIAVFFVDAIATC